jgi:phosphatidylinositol kinase/protein kinase (PI-3  family)
LIEPKEADKASEIASGLYAKPLPHKSERLEDTGLTTSSEMSMRVRQKLTGTDFEEGKALSVSEQATRLIEMATSPYNLGKMYSGWCPFW